MTFAVDRINGVRDGARRARGEAAGGRRPRRDSCARLADQVDALRKKIVATKEGGAITGEERLREYLDDLYGNVVFYEGRPSQTQLERTDALARELADVVPGFDAWTGKDLAASTIRSRRSRCRRSSLSRARNGRSRERRRAAGAQRPRWSGTR